MRDYVEWHRSYDDPASSLSRRLEVVRRRLGEALNALHRHDLRVLSLCAGDGRDVLDVVGRRAAHPEPSIVLVEQDCRLAAAAAERANAHRLSQVVVVQGDAGLASTWSEHVPVDLLLLCGIFGNISSDDVRRTIDSIPALVRHGGHIVWTRGSDPGPDLRNQLRAWCSATGLIEVAYDGPPEAFGVALNVRPPTAIDQPVPPQLFTFLR